VFDCFGAGQQVTQGTFGGRDWREGPGVAAAMSAAFGVMRQLNELLWHLTEARARVAGSPLEAEVQAALARTLAQAEQDAAGLAALDVTAARRAVGELLTQVADAVRQGLGYRAADHRGADLIGADLRGVDLRGARLRGAYLLGADLRGADLGAADLLGADLRAADVRGADLGASLFLTRPQLEAARGDAGTTVPPWATWPVHWARTAEPAARGGRRRAPRRG
jgi:hypothetical protein